MFIYLFVIVPVEGSLISYLVSLLLGFFAAGQSAGIGSYSAEIFPTTVRATGQGFVYNVGRGIAAFGPAFIGVFSAAIGMGNAIMVVGSISSLFAIIIVWMLPETNGKNILQDSGEELELKEIDEEQEVNEAMEQLETKAYKSSYK